jgi:hypothetical protein
VNTILYGVRDQAALYCLLARLRALGIETIGLRRGPTAAPAPTADGHDVPLHTCYEVALTGTCGPVFTAVFKSLGVKRAVTTSNFLLPVSHPTRIRDIVAMLEARGLMILHIDARDQGAAWALAPVDEAPHSSTAKPRLDDPSWSGRTGHVAHHGDGLVDLQRIQRIRQFDARGCPGPGRL